jgi:hypothetical protein
VPHDARIEQGGCFEGVLVQEIGADQIPLCSRQNGMRLQRPLHLDGTPLEDLEQVPVPTFEVFQYVRQLLLGDMGVEAQDSADDVIGARLVGGLQIPGFGRRLERTHHDPGGIRPQIQSLSIQEHGLRQSDPLDHWLRIGPELRRLRR